MNPAMVSTAWEYTNKIVISLSLQRIIINIFHLKFQPNDPDDIIETVFSYASFIPTFLQVVKLYSGTIEMSQDSNAPEFFVPIIE